MEREAQGGGWETTKNKENKLLQCDGLVPRFLVLPATLLVTVFIDH